MWVEAMRDLQCGVEAIRDVLGYHGEVCRPAGYMFGRPSERWRKASGHTDDDE